MKQKHANTTFAPPLFFCAPVHAQPRMITGHHTTGLFIDRTSALGYKPVPLIKYDALTAVENTINEFVIKVVNAESTAVKTSIHLSKGDKLNSSGKISTWSAEKETDNRFDQPLKITPKQEQYSSFAPQFQEIQTPFINGLEMKEQKP